MNKNTVFICHSHLDSAFVEQLATKLKNDGIEVWYDKWMMMVGDSITQKINEGLSNSSFFVVVLSDNSIKSNWVQKELNSALMRQLSKKDITTLPTLLGIDEDKLPPLLSDIYSAKFKSDVLDESEYLKLIKPIQDENKKKTLRQFQDFFYDNAEHIDMTVQKDSPSRREVEFILQIIREEAYGNYFFKKVDNKLWFQILKQEGYFMPTHAPKPVKASNNYYQVPVWNVLPYLEKLLDQTKYSGEKAIAVDILDIINNVCTYSKKERLDNFRIWWSFVKILTNIPNHILREYLNKKNVNIGRDWIAEWITSRFNISGVESEIATKLLPKFITSDKEDIKLAEQIADAITDMDDDFFKIKKKSEERRLFDDKAKAKTKVDLYWLKQTFEKNGEKIGELCGEKFIFNLANKLKKILNHIRNIHRVVIKFQNQKFRLAAKREGEFRFRFTVKQLDLKSVKTLKPEERIFGDLIVGGKLLYKFTKSKLRNKESFVSAVKNKLKSSDSVSFLYDVPDLDKELNNLYKGIYSDYSYIWYRSLSEEPEIGIHDGKQLLVFISKIVLIAKCTTDPELGKSILSRLLSEQYQYSIFRRLALLAISSNWTEYRDLFWNFIDITEDPFEGSDYESELYYLLENNVANFSDKEKKKIEDLIKKGPDLEVYENKNEQAQYVNRWKLRWYSALRNDKDFQKLFEEQKKITGDISESDLLPERKAVKIRTGEGRSPLTVEAILNMDNIELAQYVKEFKAGNKWEDPTEGGLADTLEVAVKEKPDEFANELAPFSNVKPRYIYSILSGLRNAWKKKKKFNWSKLLAFAKSYIAKIDFSSEATREQDEGFFSRQWIMNVMADLIHEGTINHLWTFPQDCFGKAEEILEILLDKMPAEQKGKFSEYIGEDEKKAEEESKENKHIRDSVECALNTPYGRIIQAMVFNAFRMTQNEKQEKGKNIKWDPNKYEALLKQNIYEAYAFFGWYMPYFSFMNKDWTMEQIKDFEQLNNDDTKWRSFMEGYLLSNEVYKDLYISMRKHYEKAIKVKFGKDRAENKLAHHISLGYLTGIESLDDKKSLFKQIIDQLDYTQLKEIAAYFWTQAKYLRKGGAIKNDEEKKIQQKIIEFWRWIYQNRKLLEKKLKNNYKDFLVDISPLSLALDRIDSENYEWLFLSAGKFANEEFRSACFIEYLNKFEDKESIKYLGRIYLELLKGCTPIYQEEDVKSIVEKLSEPDASEIRNIYALRGYDELFKNSSKTKK